MNSVADPRLIDIQAIGSWDDALRRLGRGPFEKGRSESLTGMILPSPTVFEVQKDKSSSNRWVYGAGYLSIRPIYIPLIIDQALSVGRSRSFPSGQQWRNFLIGFKRHLPDPAPPRPKTNTKKRPAPPSAGSTSTKRSRPEPSTHAASTSVTAASSASRSEASTSVSAASSASTPSMGVANMATVANTPSTSDTPPHKRKIHPLHETLPILTGSLTHISWLGARIPLRSRAQVEEAISEDVLCEVRWHVHEQNFRLELLILDQEICPELWRAGEADSEPVRSSRKERELALRRVFPVVDELHEGFFVKGVPNVDHGLASRECRLRAPHILAFREVMLSWPNCPAVIRDASLNTRDEFLMLGLEDLVTREYCSRFLLQFGRLPIPPVRLPFASLSRKYPASFYEGLLPTSSATSQTA